MYLFVYGSAKKGFFNHERFGLSKFKLAVPSHEVKGYELINLGSYPGMVVGENPSDKVRGEVYEVDDRSPEFKFMTLVENGASYRLTCVGSVKVEKSSYDLYSFIYNGEEWGPTIPGGEWKEL